MQEQSLLRVESTYLGDSIYCRGIQGTRVNIEEEYCYLIGFKCKIDEHQKIFSVCNAVRDRKPSGKDVNFLQLAISNRLRAMKSPIHAGIVVKLGHETRSIDFKVAEKCRNHSGSDISLSRQTTLKAHKFPGA
ncbi:hypothetical protein FXO38_22535 [Capsicum annuum]|nr:hypothetical protein FXO38_22535 [Capsicum annuum]